MQGQRAIRIGIFTLALMVLAEPLHAQDFNHRTIFDEAPWISARAAGMAEAVDPIANGMEAPYYNPSAIGGINTSKDKPAVSELFFPYIGFALNHSSQSLNKALQSGSDLNDSSVSNALLRAYDGEHPYARLSLLPAVTFYRFFLGMTYDVRAASTPNPEQNDQMDVNYREQSGPVFGASYVTPKRDWYLGITGSYINRTVVDGSFPLATLNDVSSRRQAFRANQRSYAGLPVHVSSMWSGNYRWRPTVSLVARDVTSPKLKSRQADTDDLRIHEDTTLGFGLSPALGNSMMLNMVLEINRLTDKHLATEDRLRFGTELTFGNAFGAESGMSLRTGYSKAGISYGFGVNLGMFGLQAASFAEDIGVGTSHVIERRSVINLGLNIADY